MMGYRLSEGGGCFKCKSFSYKNRFRLKGFLGNEPHCHGRGDSEQEKTAQCSSNIKEREDVERVAREKATCLKEGIEAQVRPLR